LPASLSAAVKERGPASTTSAMLAKLSPSRLTDEKWNDRVEATKDGVEAASTLETDTRPDIVIIYAVCMATQGVQPLLSEAVGKQIVTVVPFHIGLISGISTSSPHRPP
jgi:hypothetical protein